MRTRTRVLTALLVVALLAAAGGGWWWWTREDRAKDAAATRAVAAYVAGWNHKDMTGVAFAQSSAAADFAAATKGLGSATVTATAGDVTRSASQATARLTVRWSLPSGRTWEYAVPVALSEQSGRWVIEPPATGSLWHPELAPGGTLTVKTLAAKRGDLLDRGGAALMPMTSVYPVQLDPTRATPESAAGLEALTGEAAGSLVAKLAAAKSSGSRAPIPVVTYRPADFDARRARLDTLVGVIYPRQEAPLAATRSFGQPLLGTYGPVTGEIVAASKGRYAAGDRAGLSGLQRQYDSVLAGTPGLQVVTGTGTVLYDIKPVDGVDVVTTLAPAVQGAAEQALTGAGATPAALVALDVTSGEVLAVANSTGDGLNRALNGHYAPGSSFKVATTYTYLTKGITSLNASVACPATVTVDGHSFRNFEGEEAGTPTFAQVFAMSCNTAFIGLSGALASGDLASGAKALGLGADWAGRIGVDGTFVGSVPETKAGTDQAATSIGQGRVEASPLAMAVVAGSVARGNYLPPTLIKSSARPAAAGGSSASASSGSASPVASPVASPRSATASAGGPSASSGAAYVPPTASPLDASAIESLRTLMRSVVTDGTGTAARDATGGEVSGKTGTAEYGTDTPPRTRAWFIGFQGDLAFAVLVEDGRSGGSVAAPLAKAFLDAYRAAPTAAAPTN